MKKINLVILPLLSIVALVGCNKDTVEYQIICRDNVKYGLYDGVDRVAHVVGYNYGLADEITIPNKVNGYPVVAISRDAFEYSNLSKITIPDSILYIGSGAFSGCSYLKDIRLPNTIEKLYSDTFKNCTALTDITLPNNISYIDDGAFLGCDSLTNITLPKSLFGLGSYAFGGCESLDKLDFSNTKLYSIGSYCFYDCSKLSDITLSDNTSAIASYSFANCSSLEKIYIPENIGILGEDIFYKCNDNLKILFESSELPSLYSYTFSSGYPFALGASKDVEAEEMFKKVDRIQYSINDYSSENATSFLHYSNNSDADIKVPAQVDYGDDKKATVTEIMPNAFSSKDSLKNIDLSLLTSLSYIGANAFYYDYNLETVTLPESSKDIYLDTGAFYKCRKLKTITNLDKIKELDLHGYTFAECYNLGNNKEAPFSFTENIQSITSTDFKDWGKSATPQYIRLEKNSYNNEGGTVTLKATGDVDGEKGETITLTLTSTPGEYSNSKYFGNAIITLGE